MTLPQRDLTTRLLQTGRALTRRILSPFHRPPKVRMLYLEVTHRCNARCIACYTKAGKEKPDVLTLEEKKSVIFQARALGAKTVSLSGSGEPLLYERVNCGGTKKKSNASTLSTDASTPAPSP